MDLGGDFEGLFLGAVEIVVELFEFGLGLRVRVRVRRCSFRGRASGLAQGGVEFVGHAVEGGGEKAIFKGADAMEAPIGIGDDLDGWGFRDALGLRGTVPLAAEVLESARSSLGRTTVWPASPWRRALRVAQGVEGGSALELRSRRVEGVFAVHDGAVRIHVGTSL